MGTHLTFLFFEVECVIVSSELKTTCLHVIKLQKKKIRTLTEIKDDLVVCLNSYKLAFSFRKLEINLK